MNKVIKAGVFTPLTRRMACNYLRHCLAKKIIHKNDSCMERGLIKFYKNRNISIIQGRDTEMELELCLTTQAGQNYKTWLYKELGWINGGQC